MKTVTATAVLIGACLSSLAHPAEFQSDYIAVTRQGAGPDVVLLHGFASNADVWKEVIAKLDKRFTLHVVQVSGFAGAPAPDKVPASYLDTIRDEVLRYVETQKLEAPVLVGHSMGGLTSLRAAAKSPDRVGGVVVVDALPFFSLIFNPSATADQVAPQAKMFEQFMIAQDETQFAEQVKQSIAILTRHQANRETALEWSKTSDRKVYAQLLREVMTLDARPELKKIRCPVTVMYAFDENANAPEERARKLYETAYADLDGVHLHGVADSFHFIMWDQPEAFLDALNDALSAASRPPAPK
jgi:pimeloyl-ACP methyl ester carboxylesterase